MLREYWDRIRKSLVQGFVGGLVVGQIEDAISRGDITALQLIALGAAGAAGMAVFTTIRVILMKPPDHPGGWGVFERALWTFMGGATAAIPVESIGAAITNLQLGALRAVLLPALAAGVSAVLSTGWNLTNGVAPLAFYAEPVSAATSVTGGYGRVNPRIPRSDPPA